MRSLLQSEPLAALGEARPKPRLLLRVQESQAVLVIRLGHAAGDEGIFVVDGARWPHHREGPELLSMRIALQDDLENHTVFCICAGTHVLAFEVQVCAFRSFPGFAAPKWMRWQATQAANSVRTQLSRTHPGRAEFDPFDRTLSVDRLRGADANQALHFAAWSLASLVTSLRPRDLLPDHAASEPGEIDLDATREMIQRNIGWLEPHPEGPILVGGRRFFPSQLDRRRDDTTELDLSIPLLACDASLRYLNNAPAALGAYYLVERARQQLARLSGRRVYPVTASAVGAWQADTRKGRAAEQVRLGLLRVLALSRSAARAEEAGPGAKGLIEGLRDFQLFEAYCWLSLCNAIGADLGSVSGRGTISRGPWELAAANLPGGMQKIKTLLAGWRDESELPSNYCPDFVAVYRDHRPVIIDAKFRTAGNLADPCDPDAFKELQAYLDEFCAPGAVMLVPSVPRGVLKGEATCEVIAVEGVTSAGTHRVWIVEVAPGRAGQTEALRKALDDVVELQKQTG